MPPSVATDVFALASARLYNEIARNDPQPFKQRLAAVAQEWACHRLGTSSAIPGNLRHTGWGRTRGTGTSHTLEVRTGPVRASRKATTAMSSQLAIPGLRLTPNRTL